MSSVQTVTCVTLADADRVVSNASATETVIGAYAFFPEGSMPSNDVTTQRDNGFALEWLMHGSSTITGEGAGDTVVFKLYAGTTPGSGGTAVMTTPAFTFPRVTIARFRMRAEITFARRNSTTLRSSPFIEFDISNGTGIADVVRAAWFTTASTNAMNLAAGNTYLWWTATFNANGASAAQYIDFRHHSVRVSGMNVQE